MDVRPERMGLNLRVVGAAHTRCVDAGVHKMSGIKTLSLVKGKEHFCFRYEPGQEAGVLDALIEMVNRRDMAFDWFDAAVLSHQLGQHLAKELKAYLPKKAA